MGTFDFLAAFTGLNARLDEQKALFTQQLGNVEGAYTASLQKLEAENKSLRVLASSVKPGNEEDMKTAIANIETSLAVIKKMCAGEDDSDNGDDNSDDGGSPDGSGDESAMRVKKLATMSIKMLKRVNFASSHLISKKAHEALVVSKGIEQLNALGHSAPIPVAAHKEDTTLEGLEGKERARAVIRSQIAAFPSNRVVTPTTQIVK